MGSPVPADGDCRHLYLDLLKRCLVNLIYQDPPVPKPFTDSVVFDAASRRAGKDWPSQAHTMIGYDRLKNIELLVESVLRDDVPGDLMEAGVARGGAAIFMRGLLGAYGITDRVVWAADSFNGFPRSAEAGLTPRSFSSPYWSELAELYARDPEPFAQVEARVGAGTSFEEVQETFARYDLLDDQVRFLRGWFHQTLPDAPITALALLRIDADLYDSTYQALAALYPKVSPYGYVIVDDYRTFEECAEAVDDYIREYAIDAHLKNVGDAVFWRREAASGSVPPAGQTTTPWPIG